MKLSNDRRPCASVLLVAALVLPLTGCHLIFPFNADQAPASDGGVDVAGDLSFDGPADGRVDPRDAPSDQALSDQALDQALSDQALSDQALDQLVPDGPVPDLTPSIDAGSPPTVVWAVASKGTGLHTVKAHDVAVDSSGNSYITGSFNGVVQLGTLTATSQGADVFVASFDPQGVLRWGEGFGGTGEDLGHRLIVDSAGSVYVCGVARGPINFGTPAVKVTGLSSSGDAFVAKYNSSTGKAEWLVLLPSKGAAACNDVVPAVGGGVHIVGTFAGDVTLDSTLTSKGDTDGFAGTLSATGTLTWSLRFGGSSADRGKALSQDSKGDLLVAGEFEGTLPINGVTSIYANSASSDFFALRHKGGALSKVFHMGGLGADTLNAMRFGPGGNLYAVGKIYGSVDLGGTFWGLLNRDNGYLIKRQGTAWSRATKVSSTKDAAEFTDLAAVSGSVYVTGAYRGGLTWSGLHTNKGKQDILLGRYSSSGQAVWTRSFGGTGDDVGRAVAAGGGNSLFVTGSFQDTVDFGGKLLSSPAGNHDVFLIKLQDQP